MVVPIFCKIGEQTTVPKMLTSLRCARSMSETVLWVMFTALLDAFSPLSWGGWEWLSSVHWGRLVLLLFAALFALESHGGSFVEQGEQGCWERCE